MKPLVVAVSTLDNTSGAGIISDARHICKANAHPFCIQSGIAVQSNQKVHLIQPTDIECFKLMIDTLPKSFDFVLKIGMICDINQIEHIQSLCKVAKAVVIDMPIISSSGYQITGTQIFNEIFTKLLPLATIFTPNKHELEYCGGVDKILSTGVGYLLIKSMSTGDFEKYNIKPNIKIKPDFVYDCLITQNKKVLLFGNKKLSLNVDKIRGTGCALSSVTAGFLANGYSIKAAIKKANKMLYKQIKSSYTVFDDISFLGL